MCLSVYLCVFVYKYFYLHTYMWWSTGAGLGRISRDSAWRARHSIAHIPSASLRVRVLVSMSVIMCSLLLFSVLLPVLCPWPYVIAECHAVESNQRCLPCEHEPGKFQGLLPFTSCTRINTTRARARKHTRTCVHIRTCPNLFPVWKEETDFIMIVHIHYV